MKLFNRLLSIFALMSMAGLVSFNAGAVSLGSENFTAGANRLSSNVRSISPEASFGETAAMHPVTLKGESLTSRPLHAPEYKDSEPSKAASTTGYNYLEGPDGSSWHYTAKYEMEDVYYNEYYTDHIIQSFTFTIYDNYYRKIGTVHDKVRYAPNEVRDRECVLDPAVSLHFFNTDDKPEVMVYHAMNTDVYINHYYYSVYSVGGEKDEEGYDIPIMNIEGRCVEVINNSSNPKDENYYYTFVLDPRVDWPLDDPDYVEKLNQTVFKLTTYKRAENDTDGPRILMEKDIYNTRVPGDTTEGIYFMSKRFNGKLYFVYSQYEKPYFVDPRGGAEDESATPDNSLVIEVYETTGEDPQFVSMTTIPVEAEESKDKLVYTFLSIGSVAWTDDVDMRFHGTPEAPAFIVARDVAFASDIDNLRSSYYIYGNDGTKLVTIAENTESMFLYRNGDPEGPLAMFVGYDAGGKYLFIFAFLYTGENLATISQNNNDDPLYATCLPIKVDGVYKFVFEMMYYDEDKYENLYSRVAWFGKEGLERIDRINMGPNVQASQLYLTNVTLDPKLFDDDDAMEYAVLVKRSNGATIRNEYLIVDDNGGWYRTFTADDGKGDPYRLSIIQGRPNRILVEYQGNGYNVTYVGLPFTTPSTGAPGEDAFGQSAVEGVFTDGETDAPVYYDLQGRRVSNPESGIYILKEGSRSRKVIF